MFDGFSQVWTVALLAQRLRDRPVPVRIAGENLVLFRDAQGNPAALVDQCPHRGVKLSLGKVKDGCLECPFHGWRFDGGGRNVHVPFSPDAKRERLFARAVPVRQVGDLLFVYTAVGVAEPPELNVPKALTDPTMARAYVERTWSCHWSRAMENMLDSPHLPFVHRTTIGRPIAKAMTETSKMVVDWEDTPWGGRQRSSVDGAESTAHLDFYRPNMMALHIPMEPRRMQVLALVIPVDAGTTRLIVVGARDFLRSRVFNPLFAKTNAIIADQDRQVVESSQPAEVPPASEEVSVATDRATLAFRKYYFASLAPRGREAPAGAPFASAPR